MLTEGALFAYLLFSYCYCAVQLGPSWRPGGLPSLWLAVPNTLVLLARAASPSGGASAARELRPAAPIADRRRHGLLLGALFVAIQTHRVAAASRSRCAPACTARCTSRSPAFTWRMSSSDCWRSRSCCSGPRSAISTPRRNAPRADRQRSTGISSMSSGSSCSRRSTSRRISGERHVGNRCRCAGLTTRRRIGTASGSRRWRSGCSAVRSPGRVQFNVNYALASHPASRPSLPRTGVPAHWAGTDATMLIVNVAALLVALAAAAVSWRTWRATRGEHQGGASHLLAIGGRAVAFSRDLRADGRHRLLCRAASSTPSRCWWCRHAPASRPALSRAAARRRGCRWQSTDDALGTDPRHGAAP